MISLTLLLLITVTHVSGDGEPVTFVNLVKQYCTDLTDSRTSPSSIWTGPPGPRGPRGNTGLRGPPGEINETEIRDIFKEELRIALPVFRGISDLLLNNQTMAKVMAEKYMARFSGNDGWTVFQRRMDGSVDFFRGWDDYVSGFGNKNGEFWLGLEQIHLLTRSAVHELRIDMIERDGTQHQANYENFEIGPASNNYKLRVSGYAGTARNEFTHDNRPSDHNGQGFTTHDADHDDCRCNCAARWKGGWWYHDCLYSNLNGVYHDLSEAGIGWGDMIMRFTEMKFRIRRH